MRDNFGLRIFDFGFLVSLSHRGVGLMPYGPEAEAQAYNPYEPEALLCHFILN
jgi:hypothetical protein